MKKLALLASVVGLGALVLMGLHVSTSHAADHRDSDMLAMAANSAADINDVYTWMTADHSKLNLVMTVQPFAAADATFSPNVQYVFHVSSMAAFGATTQTETKIICEFASATSVQCWVGGNEYVTGDPSHTAGLASTDGKVKIFAGQRKDPFFFQLGGFKHAVSDGEALVGNGTITFDANGCAQVTTPVAQQVAYDLTHNQNCVFPDATCANDDNFATANVVALVMQVDVGLVNSGGPILAVYGSTHAKP